MRMAAHPVLLQCVALGHTGTACGASSHPYSRIASPHSTPRAAENVGRSYPTKDQ